MKKSMSILVESNKGCARVTLNRPDRRNAFDANMVEEICKAFETLGQDHSVRTIVLTGSGSTFCAGADINWLGSSGTVSVSQARKDAEQLAMMFRTIDGMSLPGDRANSGRRLWRRSRIGRSLRIVVAAENATFANHDQRLRELEKTINMLTMSIATRRDDPRPERHLHDR